VRNNAITSIWNRYSESWIFYAEPNFVDPLVCLTPGASVVTLEGYAGLNNNIESARRTGTTTCPASVPRSFTTRFRPVSRACTAPAPQHAERGRDEVYRAWAGLLGHGQTQGTHHGNVEVAPALGIGADHSARARGMSGLGSYSKLRSGRRW